jgi:HK97 family phage portal protein
VQTTLDLDAAVANNGNGRPRILRVPEQRGVVGESEVMGHGFGAFYGPGSDKTIQAQQAATYYRVFSWTYAAITRIARDVASLPFIIRPEGRDEADPITSGPLYNLLKRPNHLQSPGKLRKITQIYVQSGGNAYWLLDTGSPSFRGRPREIWPLRPWWVTAIPDKNKVLGGWRYTPAGVGQVVFPPEALVHFNLVDPEDPYLGGLGPIQPISRPVLSSIAAQVWNQRFFERGTHPSSTYFETDNPLDEAGYQRLKEEVKVNYSGADKAWQPFVATDGLKVRTLQLSHTDMGFEALQRLDREQVFGVFGVPPAVGGDWRNANFAQTKSQLEIYWISTIFPIAAEFADVLNTFLVPRVQPGVEVGLDTTKVRFLQPDLDAIVRRNRDRVRSGLATPNEVLREEGRGDQTYPDGDKHYVSADMIPVELAGKKRPTGQAPSDEPVPNPDRPSDAEEEDKRRYAKAAPEDQRWSLFDRKLGKWERRLDIQWRSILEELLRHVAKKLRENPPQPPIHTTTTGPYRIKQDDEVMGLPLPVHEYLPGRDEMTLAVTGDLRPIYVAMIAEFGQEAADDILRGAEFDTGAPAVLQMVRRNEDRIGDSVVRILEDVREAIDQQFAVGTTVDEIIDIIRDRVAGEGGITRANRIARTEALAAANTGKFEGYRQMGVTDLEWLTSNDEYVRETHNAVAGGRTELGTPFRVGEAYLLYPGDPAGPPEEIVNCRCTVLAVQSEGVTPEGVVQNG